MVQRTNTLYLKIRLLTVRLLLILSSGFIPAITYADLNTFSTDSSNAIFEKAMKSYNQLNDYSAVFIRKELLNNKLQTSTMLLKFKKPDKIYMKWIDDSNSGQEIIFNPEKYNSQIIAHKGGLLGLISLSLDPKGQLAMKNQHHQIRDAGIKATMDLIYRSYLKGIERNEIDIQCLGTTKLDTKEVIVIKSLFPDKCPGFNYIAKTNETLWEIAEKHKQDMFVIQSLNSTINSPDSVSAGQPVFIPYHYCKESISYFDIDTALLIKIEVFNWNDQLYEMYYYKDLKYNSGLTETDFDQNNPDYNF